MRTAEWGRRVRPPGRAYMRSPGQPRTRLENKKHCHPKPKAKNDNAILLTKMELQLGTLVGPLQRSCLLLLFPQGKGNVNAVNEIRQNQYMEQNLHHVIGNGLAQ